MKGPAARQAQTGGLDHLAMPWFPVLPDLLLSLIRSK